MDKRIDCFIVFAGVNDSKGHDGPGFYRHHMEGIIKLIISRGAIPIIVDIPDYAIELEHAPTFSHAMKRNCVAIPI